jgi:glutamate--cysteine ligase
MLLRIFGGLRTMAMVSGVTLALVVLPDGGVASRRTGFAAAARRGRSRGRAVAASPPLEEVAQMTEPLTKEDLIAYLASGCKPKENWR